MSGPAKTKPPGASRSAAPVRAVPQQARAEQTVHRLLDAAAELIDAEGFDALTTAKVATRAGVSIGLVYRYYPDRAAIATALVRRNNDRFTTALLARLDEPHVTTWRQALATVLDVILSLHDSEPGFTSVGFADQFLTSQGLTPTVDNTVLAAGFVDLYRQRYATPGRPEPEDLALRVLVVVEICNALINRAVRSAPAQRTALMAECRTVATDYLAAILD